MENDVRLFLKNCEKILNLGKITEILKIKMKNLWGEQKKCGLKMIDFIMLFPY